MFYYKIFNLKTSATFEIPAAPEIAPTGDIDVTVTQGEVGDSFKQHENTIFFKEDYYFCYITPSELYVHVCGFNISVKNGNEIAIEPPKGGYEKELLYTFLLGTAFGGLCIQRGMLPIHGTAIEKDGKAVVLSGFSGAGKSAISEILVAKGMRFLADDVSVLEYSSDGPIIHPAYPQRKLPADTAKEIGIDCTGFEPINEDNRDKFLIKNKEQWCGEAMPLHSVVEIMAVRRNDGEYFEPQIELKTGTDSMFALRRNLYREKFYEGCGFEPQRMKLLLQAAASSKVYRLIRCADNCPVQSCVEILMAEVFDKI